MRKKSTYVSCSVDNCRYRKEGKCSLPKIEIHSIGRGDVCCDSSSTLCHSFQSRANTLKSSYEFAKEYIDEFPSEITKKEAIVID